MKRITAKEICSFLGSEGMSYTFQGDENVIVDSFANLQELREGVICWVKDKTYVNDALMARLASLHDVIVISPFEMQSSACIVTSYPRGAFFSILNSFFAEAFQHTISDQAVILTNEIGKNVHISSGCYVGAGVSIGDNTVLHPRVVLDGPCKIGKDCEIFAGAVIGSEGFGYYTDENGVSRRTMHFKGVIIGDDVDIGANTCIDRGLLTDTEIGNNVKIAKCCGVGHNVKIGEDCMIGVQTTISGSAEVGREVFIGPSSHISDHVYIGEKAKISIGSVVISDVAPGATVFGIPAARIL